LVVHPLTTFHARHRDKRVGLTCWLYQSFNGGDPCAYSLKRANGSKNSNSLFLGSVKLKVKQVCVAQFCHCCVHRDNHPVELHQCRLQSRATTRLLQLWDLFRDIIVQLCILRIERKSRHGVTLVAGFWPSDRSFPPGMLALDGSRTGIWWPELCEFGLQGRDP